jgi:hypothetical protein
MHRRVYPSSAADADLDCFFQSMGNDPDSNELGWIQANCAFHLIGLSMSNHFPAV